MDCAPRGTEKRQSVRSFVRWRTAVKNRGDDRPAGWVSADDDAPILVGAKRLALRRVAAPKVTDVTAGADHATLGHPGPPGQEAPVDAP